MGDYGSIADVGETIVGLLQDRMDPLIDSDEVALASPDDVGQGNDWRLTLFLYRLSESGYLKDGPPRRREPDPTTSRPAPLVLDLYYLLTAHPSTSGSDGTAKTVEQHSVLGRAMQVLADNAVIRGSALQGSLAADEDLRVSIQPEPVDAVLNAWSTFPDEPYRPSVVYLVSPVAIESTREVATQRVVERDVREFGIVPEAVDDE